ncbi:5'/3'-nucleotidase SurE [Streptomyces cavernicola]|uniref:5'-nucleotidase SurE n=1 Tax=Streptomyces cavernicola TaxID=3043613 RepID=A0ABT6SAB0_9ACTN|nr:5'/3'-nucleotidase SurE [Streptomyces sp. B-S-A6]MDI3405115.1 5'/3'-nucleotidase SurE [Streptomyces sp. B-S-A6]
MPGVADPQRSGRRPLGTAVATTVLVTGSGPAVAGQPRLAAGADDRPLRILISNDDGYRHPYIRQLQAALKGAGHKAVIVAPAEDQSGRGTGLTLSAKATIRAEQAEPDIWSVTGTPGDAVNFGLEHVFGSAAPDLVVSGVNAGANAGTAVNHSGTVGATVAAADAGIPAIAVSADADLTNPDDRYPSAPQAAAFAERVVERLARTADTGPLLPAGATLNINYPAHPDGGVAFTNLGKARNYTFSYVPDPASCATCYKPKLGYDPNAPESVRNADTSALAANDVSLSLLTADWGANGWAAGARPPSTEDVQRTKARLTGLRP